MLLESLIHACCTIEQRQAREKLNGGSIGGYVRTPVIMIEESGGNQLQNKGGSTSMVVTSSAFNGNGSVAILTHLLQQLMEQIQIQSQPNHSNHDNNNTTASQQSSLSVVLCCNPLFPLASEICRNHANFSSHFKIFEPMSSPETAINTDITKFRNRLLETLDRMKTQNGTAPLLIIENLSLLILQYSCSPVFQMLESLKSHVNGIVLHAKSSISALLTSEEKVMTQSFASVYIETSSAIQSRSLHSIQQEIDSNPMSLSMPGSYLKDSTKNYLLIISVQVHMNRIIGRSIEKHLQWGLNSENKLVTLSKSVSNEMDGIDTPIEQRLQSFMQEKHKQHQPIEEMGATFNLTLTEKQRNARAAASVPYASARNVGVGDAGITLAEDDDDDYEVDDDVDDPDDDLDI